MPQFLEVIAFPLLAFLIAVAVMPVLNRLALRGGFLDHPSARKIHERPVPLLGGLAVYAGVIVTLEVRGGWNDPRVAFMMLASFLVVLLGIVDDRLDLHSRYRLMLHVLLAAALSICGIRFHFFPSGSPWVALDHLVTVLWIVGVINAMNCLDCADGAAGGTCLVVLLTMAGFAWGNGRYFVSQAALAGAGAVAGFLCWNVPPARVFLGDAGSTFLGLMVAVLVILARPIPTTAWRVPLEPFVLIVPVFDLAWVHYRRYQAGIHTVRDLLSSTGKDHLPHRLMARGLNKLACMGVVAFLTALAAASVYCLVATEQLLVAAMGAVTLVAFFWRLEEDGQVVIRPEDHVAIYHVRTEPSALQPSLHHEEGAA